VCSRQFRRKIFLQNFNLTFLQIQKAIELRDQLAQRIGVVVVGPAASGKTTIWKLLQTSMAKLKIPLKSHVINPTAMPKTQVNDASFYF
jgi:type II secretory pathway predicted ATPase ExeA